MADPRTPDQLAIVLGSMNKIADPQARLNALRDLEAEAVQGETQASGTSKVDQAMGHDANGNPVINPAAYTALLASIRQSAQDANAAVQKNTPTPGQQVTANKDQAILDEMNANKAKGLGFKTDAQVSADNIANQRLGLANDQVGIGNARLGLAQQAAQLAATQAQIRDDLANKRIDLTEALRQQQVLNDQMQAAARDQTNQVNLYGHLSQEANARATDATNLLVNAQKNADDAAQHGSIVAGSVLNNTLGGANGFINSMGGGPILTTDQKVAIGQALLNGMGKATAMQQVAQAHNGNLAVMAGGGPQLTAPPVVGNAAATGTMSPTGAFQPGGGGGSAAPAPAFSGAAYDAAQDPSNPLYNPNDVPQFKAPAAAPTDRPYVGANGKLVVPAGVMT